MKRIFGLILALAMVLSLAPMTMAASTPPTRGQIYMKEDGGSYINQQAKGDLVPGKTYYIALDSEKPGRSKASADWNVSKRVSDDKKINLASTGLPINKRKYASGSNDYWYFAELKIKAMNAAEYDEDGYMLEGTVDDGGTDISVSRTVCYSNAGNGGTLTEDLQLFVFDDEDNCDISFPDGYSKITVDSKGIKNKVLLAMNTNYSDTIGNKYPSANLDFFNGNGGQFKKNATVTLEADSNKYLYQYKDGTLTDLSKYYSSHEDAFIFKTRSLDSYVRSNIKLSGAAAQPDSSSSTAPSSSSSGSNSSVSTGGLNALIANNFSNPFTIIAYGDTYENIGSTVTLKCKLNLSNLNTKKLIVYAYNAAKNQLVTLNSGAYVGTDGYLYFKTPVKGQYVITDSPLTRK